MAWIGGLQGTFLKVRLGIGLWRFRAVDRHSMRLPEYVLAIRKDKMGHWDFSVDGHGFDYALYGAKLIHHVV